MKNGKKLHARKSNRESVHTEAAADAPTLNPIELLDREDLLKLVSSMMSGGVFLNFNGK